MTTIDTCLWCKEPVLLGDWRESITEGATGRERWEHHECMARQVLGSVAHVERRCSCYVEGSDEGDPPHLTRRQAALAALAMAVSLRND